MISHGKYKTKYPPVISHLKPKNLFLYLKKKDFRRKMLQKSYSIWRTLKSRGWSLHLSIAIGVWFAWSLIHISLIPYNNLKKWRKSVEKGSGSPSRHKRNNSKPVKWNSVLLNYSLRQTSKEQIRKKKKERIPAN